MLESGEQPRIFLSAGEASGDMYASWLLDAIRARLPAAQFFGCAGPRLRASGCEALIDSEEIAVVGLAEVIREIPRVWRAYRSLLRSARSRRPHLAVLVDAPDFNLRLARHLRLWSVPVLYFVAPQAWAWRPWRAAQLQRRVSRLACIFPFEEAWFRERGVNAEYVGHPLASRVHPTGSRKEFFARHKLDPARPVLAALPGSRRGEIALNLPTMLEAARLIEARTPVQTVVAVPADVPVPESGIRVIHGETYEAVAFATVALVASGTATIETALLGTPMVVVYRVTEPTWRFGRLLVRTPFFSMVNLVAERQVVPELIQHEFTAERAAAEIQQLLADSEARRRMKADLKEVADRLCALGADPFARVAGWAVETLDRRSKAMC